VKSSGKPLISVVIPALNEAGTIERVIDQLKRSSPYPMEIIVVDGGSYDGTQERAVNGGARIVFDSRPGYGRAIRTGLEHTTGEAVVVIDADGTYRAEDLPRLLNPLLEGRADIALASRLGGTILPGAMGGLNYVGNRAFALVYDLLFGKRLKDTQTGFRALSRRALDRVELTQDGMSISTEILAQAAKRSLRIVEIPSLYRPRTGESKTKLRPFRDGLKILCTMAVQRLTV
jgi:glycosyltransferase involved in cell wall biosynthesis